MAEWQIEMMQPYVLYQMCKCVIVHNMGERVLVDWEISGLVKIG